MGASIDNLFTAILNDDRPKVKTLLKSDRGLAASRIEKAKLYKTKIFHWIYVGDTPLHLAAAGYRIEIARLLLAASADPMAAANHRRSGPLHYAADGYITGSAWDPHRQVKMIRFLLDAGADVNYPGQERRCRFAPRLPYTLCRRGALFAPTPALIQR